MAIYDDFQKLDARVGKIIEVEDFPEARKPSYKLRIDFGEGIGIKKHAHSCRKTISRRNFKTNSS